MKILKYTKLSGGKYKLELEDNSQIILYEDVILRNMLLITKEIKDINAIASENKKYEIYEISKKYLNKRICSTNEIRLYLAKRNYDKIDIEDTIKKLINNNLLNEQAYVQAYINDKINFSNDGPNKIKKSLLQNGIDENLIDENMEIDFKFVLNKLQRLIDKKIKSTKNYSGNVLRQKLITYFINLGYDKRMIEEILLNKNLFNINDGVIEYNKLFNKYSKKYKDYELEKIIRQKLYLKGYNYDKIKRAMN